MVCQDKDIDDELEIKSLDQNAMNTDKIIKNKKFNEDDQDLEADLNSRSII